MDGQRFDALTRLVGRGLTRRQFAAALGAALVGAVGGAGSGEAAACRAVGRSCREHGNCCSGLCGPNNGSSRLSCQCQTVADCPAPRACHVATCAAGVCGVVATSGGACDDGNACTQSGICQDGGCIGSDPIECPPPDQCHEPGVCRPSTGECVYAPKADGTACDDGDACTRTDTCQAGVCVGGDPVVCTALDQCHDVGVCDPATGTCSNPDKPDGTSCNDDNACTDGDTCQSGQCTGGAKVKCVTANPCLRASCDPASGCTTSPRSPGVSCADDDRCDGDETCDGQGNCVAGTPVSCGPCFRCNSANGTCEVDQSKINQSCTPTTPNRCFGGHVCDANGACVGQNPTVCTAQDQCHVAGTCDPTTGQCSNPNAQNGTDCDDNNLCTSGTTCQNGVCTAGSQIDCPQTDPCIDSACDPSTGTCVDDPKAEGASCDTGNLCTADTCEAGTCVEGPVTVSCTAPNQCQENDGVCDPATGQCRYTPKEPGTTCDDGNPCTTNECDGQGDCRSSPAPDGGACTSVSDYGMCLDAECCIHIPSVRRPGGLSGTGTAFCTSADQCCQVEETLCGFWAPIATSKTCCRPLGGSCAIAGASGFTYDCCGGASCINGVCTNT